MKPKADPSDYTYDISVDDLRRYRTLPPAVILQWLQDAQDFVVKIVRPNLKGYRTIRSDKMI
jgi:hypothetical protein